MVSFICNTCQQTVKKNKVNKHVEKCRNCWVLSCIDCSVNFEGEDYRAHNSCVSEAEKYQGALYRPKAGKAGKQDPQERWMMTVRRLAEDNSQTADIARVLRTIGDYDNVPRKKAKFVNFLKNSARIMDSGLVERVFLAVLEAWNADKPSAQTDDKPASADDAATSEEPTKELDASSKKRKRADKDVHVEVDISSLEKKAEEQAEETAAEPSTKKSKSDVKALKKAVKSAIEAKGGKIKLKSLRKALAKASVVVDLEELRTYLSGKGSSRFSIAEGGKTVSIKSK